MSEPIFEIRVRAFYTSKEADAVPSSTVLVQKDGKQLPDWDKLMTHLIKAVAEQIHGAPFTAIRAMTQEETDGYRETESHD